ncbi:transcriptional regulator PAI 2-type [Whalleya microplaca]|nr:transcriptional regulator PAI 2-type [Whalleya microplaca]
MHLRADHAETHIPTLRKLIRDNPLGVFTTAIPSQSYPLIQSSHIPFLLDVDDETSTTELGRLRGHMAKQNPQSRAIMESLAPPTGADPDVTVLEQEVLVLFTSPVQHYVTPHFYTTTKPVTGKVVPTWNYAAAQAYGRARIYCDSSSNSNATARFLTTQISDLSDYCETAVMGYSPSSSSSSSSPGAAEVKDEGKGAAWTLEQAPERYVELLRKNIIGLEIEIDRLEGKFKMSQEMVPGDNRGVIDGFRGLGSVEAGRMAEVVEARWEIKQAAKKAK